MLFPTKPLKTFTGLFNAVRLDFTPESPLAEEERSKFSANYPTTLAFLHVYLDGQDAAELIPSGYLMGILNGLLDGFAVLATGQGAPSPVGWGSDPWQFGLRSDVSHNKVYITLHVPGRWVAMQDVSVPLDRFGQEVIRLAEKWERYLHRFYHKEMLDPKWGEHYRHFRHYIARAKEALREFECR